LLDKNLGTLERTLPDVFRRKGSIPLPEDEYVVIPIDPLARDPIDAEVYVGNEDDTPSIANWTPEDVEASLEDELDPDTRGILVRADRDTDAIIGELAERFGDDFPGAPRRRTVTTGTFAPPPDALAFYLPFHQFDRNVWGIYLLLEGVAELASDLMRITRGTLPRRDCIRLARAYLYHHEAYHNAIEGFATRVEVTTRDRVYLTGCRTLYLTGGKAFHEEAMATAYGIAKAVLYLSKSQRSLAKRALRAYMRLCPPPYDDALRINAFGPEECRFLEEAHNLSLPKSPSKRADIWMASGYRTAPTLRRTSRCSYVISRRSGLAKRMKLSHIFFNRREVLKRLREAVGGELRPGGKHQKWIRGDGSRKAAIPSGSDIAIGTLGSILKQLGIEKKPQEFMRG
jgi:hypothetical protein